MKDNKSQPRNLAQHVFTSEDRLFLDTNIWLWVHGRQIPVRDVNSDNTSFKQRVYSDVFKRILKAKSIIYIDSIVISEFTHVSLRKALGSRHIKNYRGTTRMREAVQRIVKDVEAIMQHTACRLLKYNLCRPDVEELLSEFAQGHADFNDLIIAMLCKREGLTLLTDDSDFKHQGVRVLTANPKLL